MATRWESEHLWLYMLALGFDPKSKGCSGLVVGKKMFSVPNNTAFHVVALFLFTKLDQSRAAVAFRDCSFGIGNVRNPEFRKQCYIWLKDIAKQNKSSFPQITSSSLMSPGGRRFIHLFYRFARHVMIKDMKRNSVGTDIPFAEAVNLRPGNVRMAKARCRVARNKLLHIFQKEDFVLQEYKKKAQLLIKEIKQINSEYAVLQIQSCKMKQSDQNKSDKTERIQKVRRMWTLVMETLRSLKKEKEVVDSVLHGLRDQCILDGTNVVFSVPGLLVHRVESDIDQLCPRNLYEREKLNFVTVIQLLNEALRTLRDEHCQSELKQYLPIIELKVTRQKKLLWDLQSKRLEIEQQHCVSVSKSIPRKQEDWEVKWERCIGLHPFNLILRQSTELDLLRPLSPQSFSLAEDYEDSMFYQHLVSLSDVCDSVHEVCYEKDDGALEAVMDKSTLPLRRVSSLPLELSKASENRDLLIEKNLHIKTCKGKEKPVHPKKLKNEKAEAGISDMWETAGYYVNQTEPPPLKKDDLEKARDDLSEEVANTVISGLPQSDDGKGIALEDLISSLAFNPFLTRKQIPRTPENLLSEIRSSWRKAIQTEDSSDTELAPTEVMIEAPMDPRPTGVEKVSDSKFMDTIPHVDFDHSLSERKSQLSSTKFTSEEEMRLSHILEPPVSETSGMREKERTEAQELKCISSNERSVEDSKQTFQYIEKSTNTPDTCSENNSRTSVLTSDSSWGLLMDCMLPWNASLLLSSASHEAAHLRILDETLPEELNNVNPNKSASSESDFDVTDSAYVTDSSKNKGHVKKSKVDLQSPLNTYKALKNTASGSEEELCQTHNVCESVSCRSDPSLASEKSKRDELHRPLELFCLDEEFTKTPSPVSLNERKYSLSSLLVSCQHLEEMASVVHEIPLDLIHKLKGKEQLNGKPSTKEPSSG